MCCGDLGKFQGSVHAFATALCVNLSSALLLASSWMLITKGNHPDSWRNTHSRENQKAWPMFVLVDSCILWQGGVKALRLHSTWATDTKYSLLQFGVEYSSHSETLLLLHCVFMGLESQGSLASLPLCFFLDLVSALGPALTYLPPIVKTQSAWHTPPQ